jgi:putative FmdB family regulatory protein
MPTYEYRCKSCGHEFEELQSMTAAPLTICPKCAEPTLRRVMGGGGGMIFKGSGFYLTDYKKSSSSAPAGPSKESKGEKPAPDKPSGDNPASEKPVSSKSASGGTEKA